MHTWNSEIVGFSIGLISVEHFDKIFVILGLDQLDEDCSRVRRPDVVEDIHGTGESSHCDVMLHEQKPNLISQQYMH